MKNIIISFVSQKGGVGKSTLSRAVSVGASQENQTVKIADLDTQQGTSTDWHRQRLNNGFNSIGSVELFGTAENALKEAKNFDFLIIDCPARASKSTLKIAKKSDLVLIPTGASRDDLIPAIKLGFELEEINKKNVYLVLTRILTEAEAKDGKEFIQETGLKVIDSFLMEKAGYKQAQNEGLSILETKYKTLNEKADNLISSIIEKL